jgi:hypothetical protein
MSKDLIEEKKETGVVGKVVATGTVVVAGATNAMAAATLTAPTFALDDVSIVAIALLTGLAGFWAIKKGLGLARS